MLPVTLLAQGDPQWASKLVGVTTNPTKTYAAVGCVVTALTIAANALLGRRLLPSDLQPGGSAGLTSAHYTGVGINSGPAAAALGLKIVGRIGESAANRTELGLSTMRGAIDKALASGGLALVRVDYDLSSPESNHTLVCFGRDATGYLCADPAGGKKVTLSLTGLFTQRSPTKTYAAVGVAPIFRA